MLYSTPKSILYYVFVKDRYSFNIWTNITTLLRRPKLVSLFIKTLKFNCTVSTDKLYILTVVQIPWRNNTTVHSKCSKWVITTNRLLLLTNKLNSVWAFSCTVYKHAEKVSKHAQVLCCQNIVIAFLFKHAISNNFKEGVLDKTA